jgi:hypothetical protein
VNYLKLLESLEKTCLILKDKEIIYSSTKKGVAPMIDFYENVYDNHEHLIVVDKIMGKGAVLLAILIGAKEIHTPIISEIALSYARENKLNVNYLNTVPYIINRTNDGKCPIETSVISISNIQKGYKVIKETLNELSKK